MPRVIDIQRRHMELGRIRMGEKNAKGGPSRLETWRLTSASRDLLESAAKVYGGEVAEWTDAPDKGYYELTTDTAALDVMVPPGDSYSQYYEQWTGGGCKRRCDGQTELLTGSACKCDPDERDCKITTRINVMLPRIAGLGVWRLESHGYYAAAELPDMLELLQQVSGGRLVGGVLWIEQRSSKKDGRTNRYPVPVLDLPNITLASMLGGQVIVNPPAAIDTARPQLTGAPDPANGTFSEHESPGWGERPTLPDRGPSLREQIVDALREHGMGTSDLERIADELGVKQGTPASDDQLRAILARIKQPAQEQHPTIGGVGAAPEPVSQPSSGVSPAPAESSEAGGVPPAAAPPAAPTPEEIAARTGGEVLPPRPKTDEYKALPPTERAAAKAYWAEQDAKPEPTLAEQMGAPLT